MSEVIYKEIAPFPDTPELWKEITIDAGGSQSTLQDIKLPETAGCYTYKESGNITDATSNRFIYWSTSNDIIEFVEISLDSNLMRNQLRLRLKHTPILQGTSIHELSNQVIILIATVSTVHKLWFSHPNELQTRGSFWRKSDVTVPSIFYDFDDKKVSEHSAYFVLNHAAIGIPLPHTSCSWLSSNCDANFILANHSGSHQLTCLPARSCVRVTSIELIRKSVMSRIWDGITRSNQTSDVSLSLVSQSDSTDTFVFSLCCDLRIAMWSLNKLDLISVTPIFGHPSETSNLVSLNFNTQQCWMKKSVGTTSTNFYLAVYVCLPEQNKFCIFQPSLASDQHTIPLLATLYCSKDDLVDFCVSENQIFTLWLNSNSEPLAKVCMINSYGRQAIQDVDWISVHLQPSVSREVFFFEESGPQKTYLKQIFHQGRFSPLNIRKAINVFQRTMGISMVNNSITDGTLMEEVVKVVNNQICSKEKASELNEEARQELQMNCWDRFFSYCIQYHEVGTKPLGLYLNSATGYVVLIKKNTYSVLCPSDQLEQAILEPSKVQFNSIILEDSDLSPGLTAIFQCLNIISQNVPNDELFLFEFDLFQSQPLLELATNIANKLAELPLEGENILMQMQLQPVVRLLAAFKRVLEHLDLTTSNEDIDSDGVASMEFSKFLSSDAGVSMLCKGVTQFVTNRFKLCRDLLILELLLQKLGDSCGLTYKNMWQFQSEIIRKTELLLHAYYALKWATETEFVQTQSIFLEPAFKQISMMECPETPSVSTRNTMGKTVVYYFIVEHGRKEAFCNLSQLNNGNLPQRNWEEIHPLLVNAIAKILWPLGPHFHFIEFLLTRSQYTQLQCYIQLLMPWCEWYPFSRLFLSAYGKLIAGGHTEAAQLFVQVGFGVHSEEYLQKKISNEFVGDALVGEYYMKVIRLFEYFKLYEDIVELAKSVIHILDDDDFNKPIFWSLVFKHELMLERNLEAFTAMKNNPDSSRQKDCLRQLLVVLCEKKEFKVLVELPFTNLLEDAISILESRARSSDILHQNFYHLLHSFHVHYNNFRKAASTMYEYAMRLGQEDTTLEGLKKQRFCLLATINNMHLVDPKYAWIVKPIPKIENLHEGSSNENIGLSPKRNSDGEELPLGQYKKIEVLEICDIEREYKLIEARLLLAKRDPSSANMATTHLSAEDCVPLLVNVGLFDAAIKICKSFSLKFDSIFEGLVYRCLKLMDRPEGKYLRDDDLDFHDCFGQNECTVIESNSYMSAMEKLWYLLQHYLQKLEADGRTTYHRNVVSKLLSLGIEIPTWLKKSYQKRNASQLLYLYICNNRIEEATNYCIEYIDAVLGLGTEDFGLKFSLSPTNPPIWFPHTYIDALFEALEDVQCPVQSNELHQNLVKKTQEFDKAISSVSESMLRMKMS